MIRIEGKFIDGIDFAVVSLVLQNCRKHTAVSPQGRAIGGAGQRTRQIDRQICDLGWINEALQQ